MIKKLSQKIFLLIMISLSVVILGVILLFTFLNYQNTINSRVSMMDRFAGGELIRKSINEKPPEETSKEDVELSIEGVYNFVIKDSTIIQNSNIEQNIQAQEYAIKVSKQNRGSGIIGDYIYKIRKTKDGRTYITLMEDENAVSHVKKILVFSILLSMGAIVMIYLIAKKVSEIIVKPVEETFEKQKQFISDASHELKTPLIVSMFESMAYEKNIKLNSNIQENIMLNGNREDIEHIISTLLDNAIKHTDAEKEVFIELSKEKNEILMQIKNMGEPIPEEEREKIFERFYRIDKARNRKEKRYGLGLAIAKSTVEKYNGKIDVLYKEGFTVFKVCIPA